MMWKIATAALSAAATFSTLASAEPISNCIETDLCYQVAVPSSSASSGQGDIYYQMRASTRYSWVAMGQGTRMAGANIFVMYADGRGNVTVSPRAGRGHVMPQPDSSVQIRLLAGSGISADGQTMVANFACSNCHRWGGGSMSLASNAASYIGAYMVGAAPSNPSTSAAIDQHDSHASWQFDLTRASIATNANPYVSGGSGSGTGSGGGVSTGPAPGSGNGVTQVQSGGDTARLIMAHGIIMALVMVVLYPLGALLMPLIGNMFLHGGVQMIAFLLMWAGFGLGVIVSRDTVGFAATHTLLGTVVVALFGIQPLLGVAHHLHFRKNGGRGAISHVHIWYGRILMLLGVVNGGLGLQLANARNSFVIAYSVVAAVLFVAYAGAKAVGVMRKKKNSSRGAGVSDEERRRKEQAEQISPAGSYRQ